MGVVLVTAHGHLGASDADVLRPVLGDLIEGQGNLKVVLDVHDVSGIDGSSLQALVGAVDAAAQLGGELTFADPNETSIKALVAVGLGDAITPGQELPPAGTGVGSARSGIPCSTASLDGGAPSRSRASPGAPRVARGTTGANRHAGVTAAAGRECRGRPRSAAA